MRMRDGFTLLETLMVIAIIAILIATTLPSLRASRLRADELITLGRLRQHAMVLSAYNAEHQGWYPWMGDPADPTNSIVSFGNGDLRRFGYFDSRTIWHHFLADAYYEGIHRHEMFHAAGPQSDPSSNFVSIWYTASFKADPKFWRYEERTGPDQWRVVRDHEVRFPSHKGAFSAGAYEFGLPIELVGFVDASARRVRSENIMPYYRLGTGRWPGSDITSRGFPIIHAIDGAHGRDER
ncbi:MAG TPA: hypothetical protein DEB06_02855 [Phycisphaerales bacterium]|nr:hypothetical protein [Phycisphaerales bacterium]